MKLQLPMPNLTQLRRPAAWVLAGVISATAVTAIAVQDVQGRTQATSGADCDGLRDAAKNAMNNHLLIVDSFMKGASDSMQNAVSKTGNSCIGDLALGNFDLSNLIPDFGTLGALLSGAVDKLMNAVANRVCNEVKDVVQTATGSWNGAVGDINNQLNLNGQVQSWARNVDYRIDGAINSKIGSTAPPRTDLNGIVTPPVVCVDTANGKVCSDGRPASGGAAQSSSPPPSPASNNSSGALSLPVRP